MRLIETPFRASKCELAYRLKSRSYISKDLLMMELPLSLAKSLHVLLNGYST